jgi:hypothetical protein
MSSARRISLAAPSKKVERIRAKLAQVKKLQARIAQEQRPFSPRQAGEKLVSEMQAAEGEAFTGADLERKFGLNSATLHRRRKEHRVVFWRDAKHAFRYPKWQFTVGGALLPGVQEVLQIFRSRDEWRVMRYFLGSRRQLGGRSPLELLRTGELDKVLTHARIHAKENTW